MKSSILQQVSDVPVETVVRVQQLSNVIADATSVISEVTDEAQVIKYLDHISTRELWKQIRKWNHPMCVQSPTETLATQANVSRYVTYCPNIKAYSWGSDHHESNPCVAYLKNYY